jgi:hypothetical protein
MEALPVKGALKLKTKTAGFAMQAGREPGARHFLDRQRRAARPVPIVKPGPRPAVEGKR